MDTQFDKSNQAATMEPPKRKAPESSAHAGWDEVPAELHGFARWGVPLLTCLGFAGIIVLAAFILSKKSGVPVVKPESGVVFYEPHRPTPEPAQPTPAPKIVAVVVPPDPPAAVDAPQPVADTTAIPPDGRGGGGLTFDRTQRPFIPTGKVGVIRHPEWTNYAGLVNARIVHALENDSRTRRLNASIIVRVWIDSTGRITRTEFEDSTGDAKTDAIIRDQIITGLRVAQIPPAGMPPFIRMRVTARRPA